MSKDNKELFKYLGIIFVSVLLTTKLPRDTYSVLQYAIGPIRFDNSVLNISGLISLTIFIIGIKGLFRLERFANKSKVLIFIIVIILVIPIMKGSADLIKTTYLRAINDELKSIDLYDANVKIIDIRENQATIKFNLALVNYGREESDFKVRMQLPESLRNCLSEEVIEFGESYSTYGKSRMTNIDKKFSITIRDGCTEDKIWDSKWYWDTYIYDIYNDKGFVKVIYHGI